MNDEIKEIKHRLQLLHAECNPKAREEDINYTLDYITNLQQENERLKETNVYCNRTDCVGRIKDSRKYDSVYQEKENYKSRCEKANAELKNWEKLDLDNLLVAIRRTQNILQNGSDSK